MLAALPRSSLLLAQVAGPLSVGDGDDDLAVGVAACDGGQALARSVEGKHRGDGDVQGAGRCLIAAGEVIQVAIPQPVTSSSVLFESGFAPVPPAPLTVLDLSPLARALVTECVAWPDSQEPLPPYARSLFGALAAVTWRLAQRPSAVNVPAGQSAELRVALALTGDRLAEDLHFEDVAHEVGLAPRSLARRFEDEYGMTWRAVLRQMRVLRAIEELATSEHSVTTIAHRVGYTSLSAFDAAFRELTGRTPTQYRATFRL